MQQKSPAKRTQRDSSFPNVKRALFVGGVVTVLVTWVCALWMPTRVVFDPFESLSRAVETVDPDNVKGLHYEETGFGWSYLWLRGERFSSKGKSDVIWSPPYGGTYHRLAGWPFYAMRSRVEVVDSQLRGRPFEGGPERETKPQRTKWELPLKEILFRGVASKDLPTWLGMQRDRRLPLIPIPLGLAGNVMLYAAAYLLLNWGGRLVWRNLNLCVAISRRCASPWKEDSPWPF